VSHVLSEVALNLSASLQKDSVVFARFLVHFAEYTTKCPATLESERLALI
jgi:hypothetical protein